MKLICIILVFITGTSSCQKNDSQSMPETLATTIAKGYSFLALGDSYTIGESVPVELNFPNQTVNMLNKDSVNFQPPQIVARTGWTTDELLAGISKASADNSLNSSYDFVSLLIGVNNQYRGWSVDSYKKEFRDLIKKAIQFAGGKADHVVVLSIPDWGATPFAEGKNRREIANQIDIFNEAGKVITQEFNVHYLNITPGTRNAVNDPELVAGDGLHPSGKAYMFWAEEIAAFFKSRL